jgi:hypothetical protein
MIGKPKAKAPTEQAVRDLLERYACPVPLHVVRTRFLGSIATPVMTVSPLQIVKELWGGDLPAFDSIEDVNVLIDSLVNRFWNDLTRHQKRSQPFRLTRVPTDPTAACLRHFAQVRLEELDGFTDGLFSGVEAMDLPERAHIAVTHLAELRAMMAGICDLVDRDPLADDRTQLHATFAHLRELNRIMETEINEAVLSCTRARRQMLDLVPTDRPTIH